MFGRLDENAYLCRRLENTKRVLNESHIGKMTLQNVGSQLVTYICK